MLAGRFAEGRRLGGKLVSEAIEINALSAGDQPLHIGTAEAEMPKERVFDNLVPWTDA